MGDRVETEDDLQGTAPHTTKSHGTRSRLRAAVVLLAVIALAVLVVQSGMLGTIGNEEELQATVDDAGVWGPLLYLVLMVVLVPLNVPGILFVVPATTLFGTAGGVALSLTGGFLASAVGIVGARKLGRRALEHRLPERVRKMERRLSERGFWAVAVARCFAFLFQPLDWLCGLSSIPMRTALGGTLVGLVPPTLVIALTGGGILDLLL